MHLHLNYRTGMVEGAKSEVAMLRTEEVRQYAADLQKQIVEMNARVVEAGLVVTLGDILFEKSKAGLKRGAASRLDKLAAFLNRYPECNAVIEGHTDNSGSESSRLDLSMRRANSVKNYLVEKGVEFTRLETVGNGEHSPIAGNDSASGRLLNRRVDVIISNEATLIR